MTLLNARNWDKAPPGKDLDRAVGWFLCGWTRFPWGWHPSTNNADALEALEIAARILRPVRILVTSNGEYTVNVAYTSTSTKHAKTLGLAACRAIMHASRLYDDEPDGKPPTLATWNKSSPGFRGIAE